MHLRTLGGLGLEGSELQRPKPLLLLAYLALEGPTSRRQLAELFWRDAKDPRDVLSTSIRRLNTGGEVVSNVGRHRLCANVSCDAVEFERAAKLVDPRSLLDLYTGAFLDGLDLELGEEIEEWLYAKREHLADLCRQAHVSWPATPSSRTTSRPRSTTQSSRST